MVLGLWLRSLVVVLTVLAVVVLLSNVPEIVRIGCLIVSIAVLLDQFLLLLHQ